MMLLSSTYFNGWQLQSRTVMAPMTRGAADTDTGVIHPNTTAYYRQRARDGVGMIITEGIAIAEEARGTVGIPGLYN